MLRVAILSPAFLLLALAPAAAQLTPRAQCMLEATRARMVPGSEARATFIRRCLAAKRTYRTDAPLPR